MVHKILLVSGIGFLLIALTPITQAQSESVSQPIDSSATLSGDSLRNLDSRSATTDYRTFFPGNARLTDGSGSISTPSNQSTPSLEIDEGVGVVFGDTLDPENVQFFNSNDSDRVQKVKVEFELGE